MDGTLLGTIQEQKHNKRLFSTGKDFERDLSQLGEENSIT